MRETDIGQIRRSVSLLMFAAALAAAGGLVLSGSTPFVTAGQHGLVSDLLLTCFVLMIIAHPLRAASLGLFTRHGNSKALLISIAAYNVLAAIPYLVWLLLLLGSFVVPESLGNGGNEIREAFYVMPLITSLGPLAAFLGHLLEACTRLKGKEDPEIEAALGVGGFAVLATAGAFLLVQVL